MNLEQRERMMAKIKKLEPLSPSATACRDGLLAYAVAHGEKSEAERIRQELVKLVEGL